jgi:hypothetical protein
MEVLPSFSVLFMVMVLYPETYCSTVLKKQMPTFPSPISLSFLCSSNTTEKNLNYIVIFTKVIIICHNWIHLPQHQLRQNLQKTFLPPLLPSLSHLKSVPFILLKCYRLYMFCSSMYPPYVAFHDFHLIIFMLWT